MKAKSRVRKYHYLFHYSRGDYFVVSESLEAAYPKFFYGSGTSLVSECFDIHMRCTPQQYRNIVRYARRHFGRAFKVKRFTDIW